MFCLLCLFWCCVSLPIWFRFVSFVGYLVLVCDLCWTYRNFGFRLLGLCCGCCFGFGFGWFCILEFTWFDGFALGGLWVVYVWLVKAAVCLISYLYLGLRLRFVEIVYVLGCVVFVGIWFVVSLVVGIWCVCCLICFD